LYPVAGVSGYAFTLLLLLLLLLEQLLLLLIECLQRLLLHILLLLPPLVLQLLLLLLLVEKMLLHEKQLLLLELLRLDLPQIVFLLLALQGILRWLWLIRLPSKSWAFLRNGISRHARGVWALFARFCDSRTKRSMQRVQRGDGDGWRSSPR